MGSNHDAAIETQLTGVCGLPSTYTVSMSSEPDVGYVLCPDGMPMSGLAAAPVPTAPSTSYTGPGRSTTYDDGVSPSATVPTTPRTSRIQPTVPGDGRRRVRTAASCSAGSVMSFSMCSLWAQGGEASA
ncbi:hypothetical protein GCM10025881_07230 [Pseudolysinimonas kribbensis]|uniref:Uncharacterized protein n=1 Tax=Pseudolysinimonas kribbensis TaxID=433641 RepID=A0ABQ6K0U2_9MICO|nr:hypothetical protein [Pseudolysinimonas kribbensis]GMA93899.1 hypothetical protein GCM10025881_07230 [Pseudolysinimonas kribbensis]